MSRIVRAAEAKERLYFYSVRAGAGEVLFEVLDDELKLVGTLKMADFEGALEDQKKFRSQQA